MWRILSILGVVLASLLPQSALAVDGDDSALAADVRAYRTAVDNAVNFLAAKAQAADGSYAAHAGPGVTSLVTTAMIRNGRTPKDPLVAKSLAYLEGFIQPDGGIYRTETLYRNYETCLAILCFTQANRNGKYDEALARAERFVKDLQWDEGEGKNPTDYGYGGAGYGQHGRPDLSNSSYLVDALKALGNGPEDEAMKRVLTYVSRCQNLESEHNTTEFASKNPDGGFYYTPAGGGTSQAGQTADGGLRSYGSMTYAGLKSMIYAGVGPDDPRVKAAFEWIRKFYDVGSNPGMGDAGLYYYYHTFAKALDAMGIDELEDADGVSHNWRRELLAELVKRQKPDGSWINENPRWMEGDPALVTGYALLTLAYCRPGGGRGE